MVLDKQVRCFFLLNPWSITHEFLKFSRQRNPRISDSDLLSPIASLDEKRSIEYLRIESLDADNLNLFPYQHPLSQRLTENRTRAMSILTLVLMNELAYVTGITDPNGYVQLNENLAVEIGKNDPKKALTNIDKVYSLETLHKTLKKLRSCDVLQPISGTNELYRLNPYILNLWNRGVILELFTQKILRAKVTAEIVLCPILLSYPRLAGDGQSDYDRLTGFHEVDLMFQFGNHMYFVECKNFTSTPGELGRQYDEHMKFLGKTADIERYYAISSRKILVQTSNLHRLLDGNPRDDFLVCDCDSTVGNLKEALMWITSG